MSSTPATNVSHLPLAERHRFDGGFWYVGFDDSPVGIRFTCPCGCRQTSFLRFVRPESAELPAWTWNGDRDNPGLTELIDLRKSCGWIGRLEKGRWTPK